MTALFIDGLAESLELVGLEAANAAARLSKYACVMDGIPVNPVKILDRVGE
jgi:phosphate uptake regulator